jgi:5-carboxymethyl-2-hydroxymuconate isomerase
VYLNLRMGRGRTDPVKRRAGAALLAAAKAHFEPLLATRYIGITLQIDEGQEVFDAKHSTIHPLFRKP